MLATLRETIAALRGAGEQEERLRQEAADLQARLHAAEAAEVGAARTHPCSKGTRPLPAQQLVLILNLLDRSLHSYVETVVSCC